MNTVGRCKNEKARSKGFTSAGEPAMPDAARPDGHLFSIAVERHRKLRSATMWQLGSEMLCRIREGAGFEQNDYTGWLGARLLREMQGNFDFHQNRFARQRLADLYNVFVTCVEPRPPIEGACWVELGCGGANPLSLLMVLVALGARLGVGVDLDHVHDAPAAASALADAAALMILDPTCIAHDVLIDSQKVLSNLAGLDLAKLRRGDFESLDSGRLKFLRESAYDISLPDGEADVVISNAFLEHVPDVGRCLGEIARITKPGGYSIHNIDMTDHRHYAGLSGPLDFLRENSSLPIVYDCNRLRLSEFVAAMQSAGLRVTDVRKYNERLKITPAIRNRFAERFRSMSLEDLECGTAAIVARKE